MAAGHASMPPSSDVEAVAGSGKETADSGGAMAVDVESKGTWWQAAFHMTTATLGPASLSLPYALRGLGWTLGLAALSAVAAVTFYAYFLLSRVLDRREAAGRRHVRFRELAADVLASRWATGLVVTVQVAINVGASIGSILLAADCLELTYSRYAPSSGSLKLYHFVIMVAAALAVLSQLPSLHSLRHINVGSLVVSVGYTVLVSAACICAGLSSDAPARDYSLRASSSDKTFTAFLSVSILTSVFGNSIPPEIQATLAPPAAGKMTRALVLSYSVFFVAFYLPAIAGYWAFGSQVRSNVMQSLMPDSGPSLAPAWMLGLAVVLILLQLIAVALVYLQVTYEMIEKSSAAALLCKGKLAPRVALRAAYVAALAFVAAMLPFFGEIQGVVGSVGYIPLDVVIPVVMYNMAMTPRRRSPTYFANVAIIVVFVGLGVIGAVASVRKLVLNADRFKLFSNGRS